MARWSGPGGAGRSRWSRRHAWRHLAPSDSDDWTQRSGAVFALSFGHVRRHLHVDDDGRQPATSRTRFKSRLVIAGVAVMQQAVGAIRQSRVIVASTISLMASWGVNSLLGFFFWFAATRSFSPDAVGLASATVSASILIGRLTVTGLGTSLAGFLPTFGGSRGGLVATAMLVAAGIGAVLGFVFAVVAPLVWREYSPLIAAPSYLLLFMIGVALTSVGVVLDQVLISLHRHDLQLFRNVVFAGSKLVLLVVVATTIGGVSAMLIFGVWALGDAGALVALAAYVRARVPAQAASFQWLVVLSLARNAVGHHAISACRTGPALFMPVLVTGVLTASVNAAFYVALIITTALQIVASSVSFTLYAVGARSPVALRHQLRVTLSLSTVIVSGGFVALVLIGPWLLGIFGPTYVAVAGPSLPWLAALAFPLIIIDHWIALRRIRNEMRGTVAILAVGAVMQILFSWVGAVSDGLTGLAIGWFVAMTLTSLLMVKELAQAALGHDVERLFSRPETINDPDYGLPPTVDGTSIATLEPSVSVAPSTSSLASDGASTATTSEAAEPPMDRPVPTTHISVFIPIRNDVRWLPGAIESVLAQTHAAWDLIIGDNASTDDIPAVLARYEDPRIRYHRFERSASIFENWNRTAALSQGDWMLPLAADDRFRPELLTRLAQAIEAYPDDDLPLAMVVATCRRVFTDGTSADRIWYGSKPKQAFRDTVYSPEDWLVVCTSDGQQPWSIESTATNRAIVEETGGLLRPEVGLSADVDMAMRLGAYGRVAYITDELLDYTVRTDADNPGRFEFNRSSGNSETNVGIAYRNAMRVHDEVRGLTPVERRRFADAIARSHLQRAAQHRVLPGGRGRSGAIRDVARAIGRSPALALRPTNLAFSAGVILAPRRLLEYAKDRVTERRHGHDDLVKVDEPA
jgi:O-antigen/teichoic acid export membrane protein